MQFTIALASTILAFATGITALPQSGSNTVTLAISNDQSGAQGSVTVVADGVPRSVATLFAGSPIAAGNTIIGTSARLTKFTDNTKCKFVQGSWVIEIDGRSKNFVELDGVPGKAVPVSLNGFSFTCTSA